MQSRFIEIITFFTYKNENRKLIIISIKVLVLFNYEINNLLNYNAIY